jgi:hypothetical protein
VISSRDQLATRESQAGPFGVAVRFVVPMKPGNSGGGILRYPFRGLHSVHICYGLQTCQVALSDPLHRRLQQLRFLHYCSDCYRVERTSSRAGIAPAVDLHLFTAHRMTITVPAIATEVIAPSDRATASPFTPNNVPR